MNKNEKYLRVINECLQHRDVLQVSSIDELRSSKKSVERCISCVLDEFINKGLCEDYEPNEYGILLEDIIDFLNSLLFQTR